MVWGLCLLDFEFHASCFVGFHLHLAAGTECFWESTLHFAGLFAKVLLISIVGSTSILSALIWASCRVPGASVANLLQRMEVLYNLQVRDGGSVVVHEDIDGVVAISIFCMWQWMQRRLPVIKEFQTYWAADVVAFVVGSILFAVQRLQMPCVYCAT